MCVACGARRYGPPCAVCPTGIPRARLARHPSTVTCSPQCSTTYRGQISSTSTLLRHRARVAAGLCRRCGRPAVTGSACEDHRQERNERYAQRPSEQVERGRKGRRQRARQIRLEATTAGVCVVCREPAITRKHCEPHRRQANATARARLQVLRDAGLCRLCREPAVTRDFCQRHRDAHNADLRRRQRTMTH